jgi:two-component system, sensor histidine kinase and response regulator
MYHINLDSQIEVLQSQYLLDDHIIVSVADKNSKITYVNDRFCNISGYDRNELLGQNHSLLKSQEHSSEFYQDLWKRLSLGKTWSGEICNLKKSGEKYWVKASITPFLDDAGTLQKYVSYRTDISDIKRQEQAHLSLLNSMAECIHGLDQDGYCAFINPAASKALGYKEQELIGHRLHDLIHHHNHDGTKLLESECAVFKTLQDKQVRKCEDWFIKKDGNGFPVELIIAPRFENGKFVGALLSYHDITHRKIAEQKLQQSEERLSIAIQGAQDGVWDWYLLSGEVIVSALYAEMLGYSKEEFTPFTVETWLDMLHPEDKENSTQILQDHLDNKSEFYENTFRLRCKNGEWKWILARGKIVSFNKDGQPIRMTGIHTDISRQKQLETDLQQAKYYAEQANQAKSAFLSSMSHELRTPLNAILGFSQLLKMDPEFHLADSQTENVDHIISGGNHLLNLINEVLQLSAIEAGEVTLNIEKLSLNELIQEVILLTQPIADANDISVNFSASSEVIAQADKTKLKQVLINLVSNAIKYNHAGGSVNIDSTESSDTHIKVTISDTGIGIAKREHPKVFSAFNRLGQETSSIEGTGIGLVVTKSLIELMNGSIDFNSEEGKGSSFWFEIPLVQTLNDYQKDDVVPFDSSSTIIESPSMRNVLYVEDNIENSQLMQRYFDMLPNLDLHIADTAEAGLEMMGKQSFALVLMDINLPGLDGITLTKHLKSLKDFAHIPVIAITANAMPQDTEAADGVFDMYLTKPIDFNVLANELQRCIQSITYSSG